MKRTLTMSGVGLPVEPADLEKLMAEPGFAARGATVGSGSAPRDR